MSSLADLPRKIKSQILGLVIDEAKNSHKSLSAYACVSPEWQHASEAQTYNNLTLRCRPRDVTEFGINITQVGSSILVPDAITKLVTQLSRWETTRPDANTGLTLELGAYSSTFEREIDHQLPQTSAAHYSAHLNGTLSNTDSANRRDPFVRELHKYNKEIRRVSGHISWPLPVNTYPPVGLKSLKVTDVRLSEVNAPVVTGFLVRLRHMRNFSPQAVARMISSLPLLKDVRIEHWRFGDAQLYDNAEPCALKRLSLYEECSTLYGHQQTRGDFNFGPGLAHSILDASRNLEQLSVSFMLRAEEFLDFEHFRTDTEIDEWPRLREVALTSRKILADVPSELLLAAARTAMRMPALETLELWFSERGGHMGVFRYMCEGGRGDGQGPTIEFFRSFGCIIDKEVTDAWREVADQKGWRDYQLGARRCGVKRDMGEAEKEYWMRNHRKEIVAKAWAEKWSHKRRENGPGHVVDLLELKDLVLHELSRDLVKV
ncbi:hypothetical protein GE09DRAFT_1225461 [Coniochaeta sp. 2T2.1]|nr:hypothetical protein GE09DRAFT_1225461 [Coniochaeta sp. 2T2.1]